MYFVALFCIGFGVFSYAGKPNRHVVCRQSLLRFMIKIMGKWTLWFILYLKILFWGIVGWIDIWKFKDR